MRRTFVAILALALFNLPLFQAASQMDYKTLTVYTLFPIRNCPRTITNSRRYTGHQNPERQALRGELLARVTAEKNNPQASVWFGGSLDNFVPAGKAGLLEAYQSPS